MILNISAHPSCLYSRQHVTCCSLETPTSSTSFRRRVHVRTDNIGSSCFTFVNLSIASKVTEISKISVVMYVLDLDHFLDGKLQLTEY